MSNIYETTETLNINQAVKKSYQTSGALFKNIRYLFESDEETTTDSRFTGPIGIAQITNQSSKKGLQSIAELIALISFSLGIFNLAAETHVDRSIDDAQNFIRSNILGVYNLLECIRKLDKKLKNKIREKVPNIKDFSLI